MLKDKKVLVTGAGGMIGLELREQLKELGADVHIADICYGSWADLREYKNCKKLCKGKEIVFHLAGIKGNPKMTKERPVDFMAPMLQFDTNMIRAAQECKVKKFLYTSSIAVEHPESDKYPAWAKQTAENLIEAMRIQYPQGTQWTIVRPANVYGRYDNFNNPNAMVITSLIAKALKDKELILDKKGILQIRDFINAKDVARGMIQAIEGIDAYQKYPCNLCSGIPVRIADIIPIIEEETKCKVIYEDLLIPLGPEKKVMKLNWDFRPDVYLLDGIKEAIEYAKKQLGA